MGTGSSGGNATDGNNIPSPRPFANDEDEIENYTYKSIYGGDGGHYKNYVKTGNYNSLNKQGMFELKNYIKKVLREQAYGHATLTTQRQSISRAPGVWEQENEDQSGLWQRAKDLADSYSTHQLKNRLKQVYIDMEEEAEPEGGPIADQYADEIEAYEKAIEYKRQGTPLKDPGGPSYDADKTYHEVVLMDRLVGMEDAYEYDKGVITIYPGLGSLQYKERATQDISFTKEGGEIHFVHVFGYQRTYQELKNVFPELPEMRGSSYSGFMNAGTSSNIPVDLETAQDMVKAMRKGRDAEADAQSAFYTRQPGRGGTGVEEGNGYDGYPDGYPGNWDSKPDEKFGGLPFPATAEDIEEQGGNQSGQPDQDAAKGTGQANKKAIKGPKLKKHKYDPDDLQKKQIELLVMQLENMKVDIKNMKTQIRYQTKTKSSADPKQQSQISKGISDQKKALKALEKSFKQQTKQISDMKKTKTKGAAAPQKEGFIKSSAKSLLNQYENERGNSNLREHMRSHKKLARRQMLMETATKKFFEYFDAGKTNEEIVQLYAQKGVSVPEQFASKLRGHYESLKKLKLELETSEQNFK